MAHSSDARRAFQMRLSILCFALGVCWLQMQADLPDAAMLSVLACTAALSGGMSITPKLRVALPVGVFLLGICWAGWMAQLRIDDALAEADEGRDLRIVGVVSRMPQAFDNGLAFDFAVEQSAVPVPKHIALAWYRGWRRTTDVVEEAEFHDAPRLHAGERWQITVRLKRPHGNVNPDGFDYEAWLLESGVRATGYVRTSPENRRLEAFVPGPATIVERLREDIRDRLQRAMAGRPHAGILIALTVGDQRAIGNDLWRIFSRSGITHLMSISGLHITMLASLAFALTGWLWRRFPPLMLRVPAQRAAVVGGFVAALAYCLIAGYAVPAQRTLYMLAVVAVALWMQRTASASRVLALALLLVLLLDPWAVLMAGFWLSFGAVGVLFYVGGGRLGKGHWFGEWGRAQWAVTVGMLPALLLLFQQFSLVSPLANAVAIPVVSFVVTPLALAAAIVPPFDFLLDPACRITDALMTFVRWLADQPWAVWQQQAPPAWAWLAGLAGSAWLLLPRGFPARWLGLAAMLPLIFTVPPRPASGAVTLVVLDVGQGLAVHLQTASHDLLYDTGPVYSHDADGGNRIIVPYLRAKGVRRLDGMIVTHSDTDHSGGAASVFDAVPVGWFASSLEDGHALSPASVETLRCADGQSWEWDGVRFEILHPPAAQYVSPPGKTNDMSCVLKVTAGRRSVLLTSDIEALSERSLLARHGAGSGLHADVLIAPHHGSRTSSTPEFIAGVGAREVIFPAGYRNRFGHPRPDVVERYRATGAVLRRTDSEGALSIDMASSGISVRGERASRWRYWFGR